MLESVLLYVTVTGPSNEDRVVIVLTKNVITHYYYYLNNCLCVCVSPSSHLFIYVFFGLAHNGNG